MSVMSTRLVKYLLTDDVDAIQKLVCMPLLFNNDEDVYVLFKLAIDKSIAVVLDIFYKRLPVDQFIKCCCEYDDLDRIKFSMHHNLAFVQKMMNNYNDSLNVCIKFNSFRMCKWLIQFHANSKPLIEADANAFYLACNYSRTKMIQLFCSENVFDINSTNLLNESALHIACKNSFNFDIIKILIDAGINVNLLDNYGDTAFDNACFYEYHEIVDYFLTQRIRIGLSVQEDDKHIRKYKKKFQNINSMRM